MCVAFWFSLRTSVTANLDSPLALTPAVVPLVLVAGWLSWRRQPEIALQKLPAVDGLCGGLFIFAALWLIWVGPAQGSWRYWADRIDLVAMDLFALGSACWLFGTLSLLRAPVALLMLALGSPPVLARLQQFAAEPLALLTSYIARPVAIFLHVPLAPTPGPTVFSLYSNVSHESLELTISYACSGLNSWLSVVLIGVPAALYLGLSRRGTVAWLACGLLLATLGNAARVVLLLVTAQRLGINVAMNVLHPWLGTLLIVGVFVALLAPIKARPLPDQPPAFDIDPVPAVALCILAVVFGAAQANLMPFASFPSQTIAGPKVTSAPDIVPQVEGWQLSQDRRLPWQIYFGPQSESLVLTYARAEQPPLVTQFVTTADRDSLLVYTPERCNLYHGDSVRGQRPVDLGAGQTGFLVDSIDYVHEPGLLNLFKSRPVLLSVLYWYVPYHVQGQEWTARFALILDSDTLGKAPEQSSADNGLAPGGRDFERMDSVLLDHARAMTGAIAAASV